MVSVQHALPSGQPHLRRASCAVLLWCLDRPASATAASSSAPRGRNRGGGEEKAYRPMLRAASGGACRGGTRTRAWPGFGRWQGQPGPGHDVIRLRSTPGRAEHVSGHHTALTTWGPTAVAQYTSACQISSRAARARAARCSGCAPQACGASRAHRAMYRQAARTAGAALSHAATWTV